LREHHAVVLAFLARPVDEPEVAADLLAETFASLLTVVRDRRRELPKSPLGWLLVTADAQAAQSSGIASTPGFLIGKTGGTLTKYEYASLTDPSGFDAAVERAAKS
jgi:hypothetical protein